MHQFLRSVGFSKLTKADLEKLFEYIIKCPTAHKVATDSEGNEFEQSLLNSPSLIPFDIQSKLPVTVHSLSNQSMTLFLCVFILTAFV